MNKLHFKALSATLLIFSYIISAQAGYSITRMTTIVDDFSGSYTVTKSGRLDKHNYTGTSITEFSNFHPFPSKNEAILSGTLSKTIERFDGLSRVSDAQLNLVAEDKTLNISFTALSFEINDGVVNISGDVIVNDETFDANAMPIKLKKLLKRIFSLTRR